MKSHKDILEQIPSLFAFARKIGVDDRQPSNWKLRDSIPPFYWQDTVGYCRKVGVLGVTYKNLQRYYQSKHKTKPPKAA